MPGRMLMMSRKTNTDSGKEPVSSVDQPATDEGLEVAPHDANKPQEGGAGECTCPNCGCIFDQETGEIFNQGEYGGEPGGPEAAFGIDMPMEGGPPMPPPEEEVAGV